MSTAAMDDLGSSWPRNSVLAFVVLIVCAVLVAMPEAFDRPVAMWINQAANQSPTLDTIVVSLDRDFTYSGVLLIAILWFCWFDSAKADSRARLAIGTLLCFPIGIASRAVQKLAATHPRPYYDEAIDFVRPSIISDPLNTWNSFPSDHATVYAGLVIVIWTVRPRIGMVAASWLVVVELVRVYIGAHYPSDLIAGAALAATLLWIAQARPIVAVGHRVESWSRSRPGLFYGSAFLICYQIATLFHGIRTSVSELAKIWLA
jgi:undecaprenyl-diphosphatase